MKNKILINLIVPELMEEYELYIPVNERISKIKELIVNSLKDLSDNKFNPTRKYNLFDPDTGEIYDNEMIIRDLNIKNSKAIILF
ncbi:MAG: hypothetical protein IKL65_02830 [Bacilli bacterium]|nr:hypothetical protein [Bacilli bacterium]